MATHRFDPPVTVRGGETIRSEMRVSNNYQRWELYASAPMFSTDPTVSAVSDFDRLTQAFQEVGNSMEEAAAGLRNFGGAIDNVRMYEGARRPGRTSRVLVEIAARRLVYDPPGGFTMQSGFRLPANAEIEVDIRMRIYRVAYAGSIVEFPYHILEDTPPVQRHGVILEALYESILRGMLEREGLPVSPSKPANNPRHAPTEVKSPRKSKRSMLGAGFRDMRYSDGSVFRLPETEEVDLKSISKRVTNGRERRRRTSSDTEPGEIFNTNDQTK